MSPNPDTTGPRCLRCDVEMETGFVPDMAYGGVMVARWTEGAPKGRRILGMKAGEVSANQYRQAMPIVAYRCPACGLLEQYAWPDIDNDRPEEHKP